jgi:hypothetical protein
VHDSQPYLARLDRQRERFGFEVRAVGLDAGYFTPMVCHGLESRGIDGVMGYRTPNHKPGTFYKREYEYDSGPATAPVLISWSSWSTRLRKVFSSPSSASATTRSPSEVTRAG